MSIKKMVGATAAAAALAAGAIGIGAPLAKAESGGEGVFDYCHLYYKHQIFPGIKVSTTAEQPNTFLCVVNVFPRPTRRDWFTTHRTWSNGDWITTKDCSWQITTTGRGEGWCTITYSSETAA